MKTAVEKINPTRVRLDVEIPFDELKDNFTQAYKTLSRQVRIPGFRPGKAPAKILEARIGRAAVLEQVINDALPGKYSQAVSESDVKAIGRPSIDIREINDGQQVTFSAEVDVRPEIELPDFSQVKVTVDSLPTIESETERDLEALRSRFATITPQNRPVKDGDLLTIDLSAAVDGQELSDIQLSDHSYVVGSGSLLPELDEAVVGAEKDKPVTFSSTLLAGPHKDKPAQITVTVKTTKERVLPDLDDSFAQLASEFDTIAELTHDVNEKVAERLPHQLLAAITDKTLHTVVENVNFSLPQSLVEDDTQAKVEQFTSQFGNDRELFASFLQSQGRKYDEFVDEVRERVTEEIKTRLLLDDIADVNDITPDQGDIQAEIINQARNYGIAPQEFLQQVLQAQAINIILEGARRSKVIRYLATQVTVVDDRDKPIDVVAITEQIISEDSHHEHDSDAVEAEDTTSEK